MTNPSSSSKSHESADSHHTDSSTLEQTGTGIHPDSGKGPHSLATSTADAPDTETGTGGAPALTLASGKGPHS